MLFNWNWFKYLLLTGEKNFLFFFPFFLFIFFRVDISYFDQPHQANTIAATCMSV